MMMKAAVFEQYEKSTTNFSFVNIKEIPIPKLGANEVLVRVIRAAANPVDILVLEGEMQKTWGDCLPMTLGYDFSGVIEELGTEVKDFTKGEEVCGVNWGKESHLPKGDGLPGGAFAQFIKVNRSILSRKPTDLSHDLAAAIGLVGTTAWEGVFEQMKLSKNQKVLILGGSGAVGFLAIQFAKMQGCEVWTTCSDCGQDLVSRAGPDHMIDYKKTNWWEMEKEFDAIFDTMGETESFGHGKRILKKDGHFISIASTEAGVDPKAHAPLHAYFFSFTQNTKIQDRLLGLLEKRQLLLPIDSTFQFTTEGVRGLLRKQNEGKSKGKNLLFID